MGGYCKLDAAKVRGHHKWVGTKDNNKEVIEKVSTMGGNKINEDTDDVIESFSLYYTFSVFPSFVYYITILIKVTFRHVGT